MLFRYSILLLVVTLLPQAVSAQLPATSLDSIYPATGNPGSQFDVKLSGKDQDDLTRLVFDHAGIKAKLKYGEPGPFDEEPPVVSQAFEVSIDSDVEPGFYEVRCHGKYGWSNPRFFLVNRGAQVVEAEPNNRIEEAQATATPATLNGQLIGQADSDWFQFDANAGQRLLIRGLSRQIDSRLDMVIVLQDDSGRTVGRSLRGVEGDPIIDFTAPRDGSYFLNVHDVTYQQGETFFYAIEIGDFPYLHSVFPPAIEPGSSQTVTVYGHNLPGGKPSAFEVDGITLEQLEVSATVPSTVGRPERIAGLIGPHQASFYGQELRVKRNDTPSNPLWLGTATASVVNEIDNNDSPESAQTIEWPCEIAGRLFPQADMDWYVFSAKEGDVIAFDVCSNRLGLPTDPALLIQRLETRDDGEIQVRDVAFVDDVTQPNNNFQRGKHEFNRDSSDPNYVLTVPSDGTYRLMVKDSYSSVISDPRAVYRLAIRKPQPDFDVVAVPGDSNGSLLLRKGGRDYVRVYLDRRDGFDEPVYLSMSGLPNGVTTADIVIGPGNTIGTFVLTAAEDASPVEGSVQIVGKATIDGTEESRSAKYGVAQRAFQFSTPNANVANVYSRLTNELRVCVSDHEQAPATLTLTGDPNYETARGGIVKIPYQVTRQEGIGGNFLGYPMNLPLNTQANQVNIGNNSEGEFEIRLRSNTTPGTYAIYLAGYMQNMRYSRNPQAAEHAESEQERYAKILENANNRVRTATTEDQQAQQELNRINQQVTQAKTLEEQRRLDAEKALVKQEQLQEIVATTKQQSQEKPEDEALKQSLASKQGELETADSELENANKLAEEALKNLDNLTTGQETAEEKKKETADELTAAQQNQQAAQRAKQQADASARTLRQQANPRNFSEHVPSPTIILTVHEYPIDVKWSVDELELTQGDKNELKISLERLYGFDGDVNVQIQRPGNLNTVQAPNGRITKDSNELAIEFSAADNSPVGEHVVTVRLQMNFNGQNLQRDVPLNLTIREKPADSGQSSESQ